MLVWGILQNYIGYLRVFLKTLSRLLVVLCSFLISLNLSVSPLRAEEIIPQIAGPVEEGKNKPDMAADEAGAQKAEQEQKEQTEFTFSPFYSELSALRLEQFSGVDATENQIGFYSGGVSGLLGHYVNSPNLKLRAVYGRSYYRYRSSRKVGDDYVETDFQGQSKFYEAMVGYEFRVDKAIFKAYGGVISETNHIDPRDPQNRLEGTKLGAKFLLESWYEFNSRHWLSSYGAYSTASAYYVAHSRYGMPLLTDLPFVSAVDVGIEAGLFGNKEFDALRFGAFSRLKTGIGEITFSAGVSGDYEEPDALYGTFQLFRKFGEF